MKTQPKVGIGHNQGPPLPPLEEQCAYSVEHFSAKHDISRAQSFKEIAEGRLPARKVGTRTIITREDAAEWRRSLPRAPVNGAAKKRSKVAANGEAKKPSDGLPPWLSEPQPPPRRAKPKTQGPVRPEYDSTK